MRRLEMAFKKFVKEFKEERERKKEDQKEYKKIYGEAYKKAKKDLLKTKAKREAKRQVLGEQVPLRKKVEGERLDPRREGMFGSPSIFGPPEEFFGATAPRERKPGMKKKKKKQKSHEREDNQGWF